MNRISVITVNYNDNLGLKKTIESVVNQNFQYFEFIIIDGGSSDGGKEIIEEYQDKIDYWVSEADNGIYHAMNKGIKVAKGDFIIFMNSGDTFADNEVLAKVESNLVDEFDIYYGDYNRVKTNSIRKKTYPEKLSFSFFFKGSLSHQSTFIRRTLFSTVFLYNEEYKIASDWEFFIYSICYKNIPYKYLNMTVSDFDFTGISSVDKFKHIGNAERRMTLEKYFPLFIDDYTYVSEFKSKRIEQVLHIQQYPIAWKFLKFVLNVILLFIPKFKR